LFAVAGVYGVVAAEYLVYGIAVRVKIFEAGVSAIH
jgi:hypothetical protein